MNDRRRYEAAVRRSELAPLTRLVLLTLAAHTDPATGLIPADLSPSLATLVTETGMSRRALIDHLKRAEAAGWLLRKVPSQTESLRHHVKTAYTLQTPAGVCEVDAGGVQETHAGSVPDAPAGVRKAHLRSVPDAHRIGSDDVRDSDLSDVPAMVADVIKEVTGRTVSRQHAADVYRQIIGGRTDIRAVRRYLETSIRREPARFLPTVPEPHGSLPVPRLAPLGERDNPANQRGAAMARALLTGSR